MEKRIGSGPSEFHECFRGRLRTNRVAYMATCLGLGSPGHRDGYSV